MKKIIFTSVAILLGVGLLAGCQKADKKSESGNKWPEKLTIVTMPDENNPEAGGKNEAFQKDMSKYLGIPVEVMEGGDYAVGIEAMKNKKLDVLLVSPMSYFQAKQRVEIDPLVTTSSNGAEAYKTVFVTRKDNDKINELKDLKGTNFAFVDPASSSGYMFPKYTLVKDLKLEPSKIEEPNYFFKTVAYSGKHDSSLMGVVKGDYEAAAVAGQVINMMSGAGLVDKDELKIIGETEEIPNPAYVMRSDLPDDLKKKIKEFYIQYEDEKYFETFYKDKSVRFVEAKDSDYETVKDMMKTLGIKGE
ncbi:MULTISPECIES: phosphate/phosphite/phosphonate ABC transporter substrate-binding protein [Vagococcus]|uniref:Phosphonate ABC transporter phosphate-binding periplasmic component (TC 3.A.1.9.1) n=1 Tax=Vagococcus fluvialis bH819 TaxID=1255619 RepID=A0A1X6WU71_9ENTE|nr:MULTISPECIES: phosphate/phosphite/phosphonate ABC transporter substrate-binding protein [Vagococcus]SLM87166.1 Phosphonate ABC transporter phosphate-binding periplasmic component (TC 3.A.1.9.1) [Vagococcus fluvialis bH819]HCM90022.1 phosphate/phosphite/phosphonate ABC transporter substrate-binding protein [Vagococcus sp.]